MKKMLVVLLVGAAAGAFAVPGRAQDAARSVFGAFLSHETEDRMDISVGVTRSGEPRREERLVEVRDTIVVPEHFGEPMAVTSTGDGAVIWYRSETGALRNVIVTDAAKRLYLVQKNGSKLVVEIARPR